MKLAPQAYALHRAAAWIAAVPVLFWTLSGLSHPIMTWLSPHPAHQVYEPVLDPTQLKLPPTDLLAQAAFPKVHGLEVVAFEGRHFYRALSCCGDFAYLDAASGKLDLDAEENYAKFLARHFCNDFVSPIKSVTRVKEFDGEYPRVFQLLPAYRVQFDRPDGMRAYVDTTTSRLGALVDDRRGMLLAFFERFHNFELFGLPETVRIGVVGLLSFLVFVVAASGTALYGLSFRKFWAQQATAATRVRRYHRTLGLVVSLSMFLFSLSGLYHVVVKLNPERRLEADQPPQVVLTHTQAPFDLLRDFPTGWDVVSLRFVTLAEGPHWRIGRQEKSNPVRDVNRNPAEYRHAVTGKVLADGERIHATQLACRWTERKPEEATRTDRLTEFAREYAAIYKRLPVEKVQFSGPEQMRVYVDTAAEQPAVRLTESGKLERLSFVMLHKWNFLNFLGKDVRDGLMIGCNLTAAAAMVLGMSLLLRRTGKSRARTQPDAAENVAKPIS